MVEAQALHRGAVALVDDVISSGTSIVAGLRLMAAVGVEPVAIGAAMLQTERWRPCLAPFNGRVVGSLATPLLARTDRGWLAAS